MFALASSLLLPLVAVPLVSGHVINPFQSQFTPRSACEGNTPDTRSSWCDFDINTDYVNVVPDTGRSRLLLPPHTPAGNGGPPRLPVVAAPVCQLVRADDGGRAWSG